MDRLSDDDLIELLGTLGVLRLEVQELREIASTMVPKAELDDRRKRIRLAGFIAAIVILIVFIPFGLVLHQSSDTAKEAKAAADASDASSKSLIQDQYDRAVNAQRSCNDRNATQAALTGLIRRLLQTEQREPASPLRDDRIAAYELAVRGTGSLTDCGVYQVQQQKLISQGAKPHS